MLDEKPIETYTHLLRALDSRKVGFVELCEPSDFNTGDHPTPASQIPQVCKIFRPFYKGIIIANQSFTLETGEKIIKDGYADMVSFGTFYIANPDLPTRFAKNLALASPDQKTMYGGGAKGYTDYPVAQV
jgi:N-ethylmaleimide reductase